MSYKYRALTPRIEELFAHGYQRGMIEDRVRVAVKEIAVRSLQRHISAATDRHVARNVTADTLPDCGQRLWNGAF